MAGLGAAVKEGKPPFLKKGSKNFGCGAVIILHMVD
jgi:hypothetical protein